MLWRMRFNFRLRPSRESINNRWEVKHCNEIKHSRKNKRSKKCCHNFHFIFIASLTFRVQPCAFHVHSSIFLRFFWWSMKCRDWSNFSSAETNPWRDRESLASFFTQQMSSSLCARIAFHPLNSGGSKRCWLLIVRHKVYKRTNDDDDDEWGKENRARR